MLGGLHIEMVLWTMCGDLLAASRWTTALTEAGIASSGTSDSFLKVVHLTKTRRAHQITEAALYKFQQCLPDPVQESLRKCWVTSKSSNTFFKHPNRPGTRAK